jgi:chromosome partitioning protein
MTRTIAVANQKGGVGKTTTAVNLSACLAEKGKQVLLIDLDPQGNATSGAGHNPDEVEKTIYNVFLGGISLKDVIRTSKVSGLDVVPANVLLSAADIAFASDIARPFLLRNAMRKTTTAALVHYEFIVIDCPPNLGLLTQNALVAAGELIIPVDARYYSVVGINILAGMVREIEEKLDHHVELLGILVNMFDRTTTHHNAILEMLKQTYGSKVFQTIITRNIDLSDAEANHMPITLFAPKSSGCRNYQTLAEELLALSEMAPSSS